MRYKERGAKGGNQVANIFFAEIQEMASHFSTWQHQPVTVSYASVSLVGKWGEGVRD